MTSVLPTFAGMAVTPNSFLDKLQESFAGPHDYFGGVVWNGYDALGNANASWAASGHASTITKSGIGVPTGTDTTGAIQPIFDAQKVTADVNAQMQITRSFSQQAPKAVGDYAAGQSAKLRAQGNEAAAKKWDEGGSYRAALHTLSGTLGGGANGAALALATAGAAPLLDDLQARAQAALEARGIGHDQAKLLAQGLAELTSAGMGAAGGTAGAAAGLGETGNNYLKHAEIDALNKKLQSCGNNQTCKDQAVADATTLSKKNDAALQSECKDNPTSPACQGHIQEALNYAGDKKETNGISKGMVTDINRSRVVVLDQTLDGGSYKAVNNIETRADFFGAMGQQTGAPWFKTAEDVSRNDLQGVPFNVGDSLSGGQLSAWRDAAGNVIMQNGLNNFRSIYNDPTTNINTWSVNQLVSEQNKLQPINQQYLSNSMPVIKLGMELKGGVTDILSPAERIKTGCIKMGMPANCGGQ